MDVGQGELCVPASCSPDCCTRRRLVKCSSPPSTLRTGVVLPECITCRNVESFTTRDTCVLSKRECLNMTPPAGAAGVKGFNPLPLSRPGICEDEDAPESGTKGCACREDCKACCVRAESRLLIFAFVLPVDPFIYRLSLGSTQTTQPRANTHSPHLTRRCDRNFLHLSTQCTNVHLSLRVQV